jgi:hypothetical protein
MGLFEIVLRERVPRFQVKAGVRKETGFALERGIFKGLTERFVG